MKKYPFELGAVGLGAIGMISKMYTYMLYDQLKRSGKSLEGFRLFMHNHGADMATYLAMPSAINLILSESKLKPRIKAILSYIPSCFLLYTNEMCDRFDNAGPKGSLDTPDCIAMIVGSTLSGIAIILDNKKNA